MDRTIELTLETYNALGKHLPEGSSLLKVFREVEIVHGPDEAVSCVISCSQEDAETLLKIAKDYCLDAVPQIEKAILKDREQ